MAKNTPNMKKNISKDKPKNFKKSIMSLINSLKGHYFLIILALSFAVASTTFSIVAPTITKNIGELIIVGGTSINMAKVTYYSVIVLIMYVLSSILNYLQGLIMSRVTSHVTYRYRREISKKINRLPLKYFDSTSFGDTLSRITNDVDKLADSLSSSLGSIVSSVTMILGAVIMMIVNSPLLTLIAVAIMPLSIGFVAIIVKFSQKYFLKNQVELGNINGQIEEIYSAHNVVTVFSGEEKAQKDFDKSNTRLYKCGVKSQVYSSLMHPVMNFVGNLGYVAVCLLGAWIAIKNNNPQFAATVVVFITYLRIFNNQVSNLANISSTIQTTAAASERVFEFLELQEQTPENKPKRLVDGVKGDVEFKNVNFGYNDDKIIIHDFSAKVKAGQKVAIVGPTGAGKTTLVNLLMRFYEVNSGDITIDGISIKDMPREEVRSLFGMVLQDAWLFEGTVRENISFGTEGLSNEEIENACCFAHIDHFIRSLSNGYDTVVDEKANISQGQKQLLTIARAMIQNSPMLILDEATSSVDTRTELQIQKAMDKLTAGRTSFIIAHRLSTIKNADLILVMKDGNIIEKGNHKTLLKQDGFYAQLYNSQFSKNPTIEIE